MKAFFFNVGAVLFLLVIGLHGITAAENSILTNNLTLTQDSVYTHIENGKAITTFKVTASSSGNYSLRFWLMGVKHTNATYSSYAMRIDNNAISDYVTTDRGDWHLYQPDNTTSTYLTQGQH